VPAELLVDEYQLAMAESFLAQGIAEEPAVFELYVRALPRSRGYLIAAGLEQAVEYLTGLRFGPRALDYLERSGTCSPRLCAALAGLRFPGDLDAVAEGTLVYAGEPLLRVSAPLLIGQFVETYLLNQVVFSTMIATKAARLVTAAGGRPVIDFGFRRAHGADAGLLAARSAYIGGIEATATVAAGLAYGVPTAGTMSHSYVLAFESEQEAFEAFLTDLPRRSTLVIDTYDTLGGAHAAVAAAHATGVAPTGVRLDSGDLLELSFAVRAILDAGGLERTQIVCSGDLDEYRIASLVASGAPVDGFGVGTSLVTSSDAPALGGVYKLVERGGRPVMKTAGVKSTLPGRHQVFRSPAGDVVGLEREPLVGRALLEPVLRGGTLACALPSLVEARARAAHCLREAPAGVRALIDPSPSPVARSGALIALQEELG
jgi:nicotinate phosphoribosyltransferase